MATTIYDFKAKDIHDNEFDFHSLHDKVILIVNTASKCGFTGQYAELEQLYKKYHSKGLEIIGFPCNQFGKQEPGNAKEIENFCNLNYDVTFPLMTKIDVNGENAHPVYKYLRNAARGIFGTKAIKWNFTKFLISKDGKTVVRFAPQVKPLKLECGIQSLLNT